MTLNQEWSTKLQETLDELLNFPLMEGLIGRRSRRFCMGAEIPYNTLIQPSNNPMESKVTAKTPSIDQVQYLTDS